MNGFKLVANPPSLVLVALVVAQLSQPASAQASVTLIEGARVFLGDGETLAHGNVVIRDGRIARVANGARPRRVKATIAAQGKFVTSGLIDVWSTLASGPRAASGRAVGKSVDTFDPYDADAIRAALRQGVTAVYVPARSASGVGGLGAVLRLLPEAPLQERVLSDEAALCAALGLDARQGPLARVKAARGLRQTWKAARDYRQAWETYEEDIEEYEKKLKERAAKPKKPAGKSKPKASAPKTRPARAQRGSKGKQDKKRDEFKKPTPPAKDRDKELLLRVLDGEMPWRVEVHWPADILNVLDVADEFNLTLILEGASGAHLVAERIARADAAVVLGGAVAPLMFVSGPTRYGRAAAAAILAEAGVRVYLGSGPASDEAWATRHLALRAALAVGHGLDADQALNALTSGAAELLGVEKQIGRVARGMAADVVIWSAHPFDPAARVERVLIAGREVYRADGVEDEPR